jgi:hypothetical protein
MKDIEGALLNPEVAGPQCQEKKAELILELWELGKLQSGCVEMRMWDVGLDEDRWVTYTGLWLYIFQRSL